MKDELTAAFNAMESGDNKEFSEAVATKASAYINGGTVTTIDAGAIPTGDFTGTGTGTIATVATIAEPIIFAACQTMNDMAAGGDDFLAAQIATAIDTMSTQAQIVKTVATGKTTTPAGVTTPMSGAAEGEFAGNKPIIENALKAIFATMAQDKQQGDNLQEGNGQFAQALENGIKAYITSGTVTTRGTANLLGSIGSGAIVLQ